MVAETDFDFTWPGRLREGLVGDMDPDRERERERARGRGRGGSSAGVGTGAVGSPTTDFVRLRRNIPMLLIFLSPLLDFAGASTTIGSGARNGEGVSGVTGRCTKTDVYPQLVKSVL